MYGIVLGAGTVVVPSVEAICRGSGIIGAVGRDNIFLLSELFYLSP